MLAGASEFTLKFPRSELSDPLHPIPKFGLISGKEPQILCFHPIRADGLTLEPKNWLFRDPPLRGCRVEARLRPASRAAIARVRGKQGKQRPCSSRTFLSRLSCSLFCPLVLSSSALPAGLNKVAGFLFFNKVGGSEVRYPLNSPNAPQMLPLAIPKAYCLPM